MGEAEDTQRSYDAVAQHYAAALADELAGKPLDRAWLDTIADGLDGGLALDVGCGPGQAAKYLADRGARTIGLDLSPRMCAITRRVAAPALAADMTELPVRDGVIAAIVSLYAVIHLNDDRRSRAYAEFARVLRPGGSALIAFHVRDADTPTGQATTPAHLFGQPVQLRFRYLHPDREIARLADAGLELTARLDRRPYPEVEHQSDRCYLLVRRPVWAH